MSEDSPRIIRVVHSVPGRTRLRLPWLRERPQEATSLADQLAELDASVHVQVRPWTGSVLCRYDPERVGEAQIVATIRRCTGVAIVLRSGERHPRAEAAQRQRFAHGGARIRDAVFDGFREMNRSVMQATEGRLDLGSLTGISFLGIGAAEILLSRKMPAPPWFNLAWYAYRTFTLSGETEDEAEAGTEAEAEGDGLGGEPFAEIE